MKIFMRPVTITDVLLCLLLISVMMASNLLNAENNLSPDKGNASVHAAHLQESDAVPSLISEDRIEADELESQGLLFPPKENRPAPDGTTLAAPAAPSISKDFIVFGYAQNEDQIFHTRWQSLTHIGSLFVGFNADGSLKSTSPFTNRSAYLKAGGAAEAAGVKVILVINSFDDAAGGVIETVMTSPTIRAILISNIKTLLESDAYVQGVSLDLEFSWGTTVRDGITNFFKELRAALPAKYEISVYTNPTFNANQWNFNAVTGITPHIDYMLYSCYTFASGNTAHAISDLDTALPRMRAYLENGLSPEKLVLTISAYSQRWAGTSVYNGVGTSKTAQGFTDARYDTTLNPNYGGPFVNNYVRGDEVGWYTYDGAVINYTATWDDPEAMEYELRHVLSFQDSTGVWNGRRLRGVGFWSLYWMAEFSSIDPLTSTAVTRTRTYPHIYQLCQEIFSQPGHKRYIIEGYEGLDHRWRDPNESPDTFGDTDGDSARQIVAAPSGIGAPEKTTNAMQVKFDFEGAGNNALFFRHEILASPLAPAIPDVNAASAHFDSTTCISVHLHNSISYPAYWVRLAVIDSRRELEVSAPFPLGKSGWREVTWDLTNSAGVIGRNTAESAFKNGDGIIHTAGDGARDIAFVGFILEGSGPVSGNVTMDEVSYQHSNPGEKNYTINEFRYEDSSQEFVEIYGPAGSFPNGLQLRLYNSADATYSDIALAGMSVPDHGGGYGYFVIGDPAVPNVNGTLNFSAAGDDIPNVNPGAIQLYDPLTGCVYDSVVYEAWGGLADLIRQQTRGVTGEGYPWLGQISGETDSAGQPCTMGRFPDGRDTQVNFNDFSFMAATPGRSNGKKVYYGSVFDFETVPNGAFQTFQTFHLANPLAAGLPASPNGGMAHRCVDTVGGGVISVIGDAALGADGKGYIVTGEIYIPRSDEPAQAIAIGICGRQGSNFFSSTARNDASYESGYWLIYQNRAGIGLNNGRADHPGNFEFLYAKNDNMSALPATILGAQTLAALQAQEGAWTTFSLSIDPEAPPQEQIKVIINWYGVYYGPIPDGGPISGVVQIGFRENHTGAPAVSEDTWIDNLAIRSNGPESAGSSWTAF
ncbi:MAG TPA: glycoside hydrolase family 18 protein [Candidatus Sumerlaeota bacterium]|nr:glycoside hydrolase family 18 protein [Candidatus Sumerlaeota bacterium]